MNIETEMNIETLDLKAMCNTKPEPINFILPGLAAGTCGGIVSPGGTGKSMLILEVAIQKSSGADSRLHRLFGQPDLMKIAYISAEDPSNQLHHRIFNIANAPGAEIYEQNIEAMHQNLSIYSAYGAGIDLNKASGAKFIEKASKDKQLVIIDTMRRVHNSNENDNGEMSELLGVTEKISRDTGAAILFLHHVPKPSLHFANNPSARGASSITDNLRYMSSLRAINDKEAEKFEVPDSERWKHVVFSVLKHSYSGPVPDAWLVKENKGVLAYQGDVEDVLRGATAPPKLIKTSKVEDKEYADDDF